MRRFALPSSHPLDGEAIASKTDRERIEAHFQPFIEIFPNRETHKLAADLYRTVRRSGYKIRSSIDCLFAACCLQQDARILARDRDFAFLAQVSDLKTAVFKT